ncbi:MAG: DNA-binding response regulator [Bacteroidetes bacterium MED-G21]|nr:MAG: DNA-binding response regulator [Bacteroidetes bacterium MED-G21]
MKLKTLILDDEKFSRDILEILINEHCPEIEIVGKCSSAADARDLMKLNEINLVFLDIEMPNETGFDFLNSIPNRDFSVIFITAYNQFALNAIKESALDYILKPINFEELKTSVSKAVDDYNFKCIEQKNIELEELLNQVKNNSNEISSISVLVNGDYRLLNISDINFLEASNSYCIIHMINNDEHVITKTLKEFNNILSKDQFIRIHKSYLVNKYEIHSYSRNNGITIVLNNGRKLNVSRRRQSVFFDAINS